MTWLFWVQARQAPRDVAHVRRAAAEDGRPVHVVAQIGQRLAPQVAEYVVLHQRLVEGFGLLDLHRAAGGQRARFEARGDLLAEVL